MDEQKEPLEQIPVEPVKEAQPATVADISDIEIPASQFVSAEAPVTEQAAAFNPDAVYAPQQPYAAQQQPYAQTGQTNQSYGQTQPPYGQAEQPYYQQQPYGQPQQPYYQQANYPPVARTDKDHVVAGVLAILLGSLGIHKFYLGYRNEGLVMLLISVVGSCTVIAPIVMIIIGIIEGILYLMNSQSDFEQMYVFGRRGWF